MVTCLNRVGRDGKEEAGMKKKTESLTVVWRLHQTVTGREVPTGASVVCVFTFTLCPNIGGLLQ